jgi:hydroxyethylthiazole kinase-like uncharacterized protein yjeF
MVRIERASDAAGHSYDAMMEQAGQAVAAATLRHMHPWDSDGGALLLVGPGNNGGDGLVAARYLHQWQPQRPIAIYCWKRTPQDDPNYEAARRLKLPMVHAEEDPNYEQLRALAVDADVIVDALLGTGVARPISGPLAALLEAVKQGVAQRRQEEMRAADDREPAEPASSPSAALALRPVADFDFLRLPAPRCFPPPAGCRGGLPQRAELRHRRAGPGQPASRSDRHLRPSQTRAFQRRRASRLRPAGGG